MNENFDHHELEKDASGSSRVDESGAEVAIKVIIHK